MDNSLLKNGAENKIDSLNNRILSIKNELDHIMPGIDSCPDNVRGELVSIICKLEREKDDLIAQKQALEEVTNI